MWYNGVKVSLSAYVLLLLNLSSTFWGLAFLGLGNMGNTKITCTSTYTWPWSSFGRFFFHIILALFGEEMLSISDACTNTILLLMLLLFVHLLGVRRLFRCLSACFPASYRLPPCTYGCLDLPSITKQRLGQRLGF